MTSAQEQRLIAIAAASAAAFRRNDYHQVRAEDVAELVRLPRGTDGGSGRSAVWLYNEVKSRRVLVALAAKHAFDEFVSGDPEAVSPTTMLDAQEVVTAALRRIAQFHQVERFMMNQIRLGIGDISTSEKRPSSDHTSPVWASGVYGAMASAGWEGRVAAYAEYLAPRLELAARTVTLPPEGWAAAGAKRLSELAFRVLVDDEDGPVDRQALALAAHWFARDLIPLAGEWADRLHTAERMAELAEQTGWNGRPRVRALEAVLQVLTDGSPLLRRTVDVSTELTGLLTRTPTDCQTLSDVTSRQGLALLRLGDLPGATACFERSRLIALELPEAADPESYVARAEHNLAEVLVESGRPGEGSRRLRDVQAKRERGVSDTGTDAGWRRLTITQQAMARAASMAGRVVDGVVFAEAVLADREQRLGPENVNTASARATLAEALLTAGHPGQARHHLTEAMRPRIRQLPAEGYWPQHDIVHLAQIEMTAGFPEQALRLLTGATVATDWFAERVSLQLHRRAALVHCMALTASGETALALAELEALSSLRGVRRAQAAALLIQGDATAATETLGLLAEEERGDGDDFPSLAETLLLLARSRHALGDALGADEASAELAALAGGSIDLLHPVILAGRLDAALRRAAAGQVEEVPALLTPLLSRELGDHGRSPLGDGHPLLTEARLLATRVGEPLPSGPQDPLWENL
jgi:hypothetical protein